MLSPFLRFLHGRTLAYTLPVAAVLVLAVCMRSPGMPYTWGPIARGDAGGCPDLSGRFVYADRPVEFVLAGRHVPWDSVPAMVDYFTLAGSADSALHLTIGYVDGRQYEKRLARGSSDAGGYQCKDGWLTLGDDVIPNQFDAEFAAKGFHPKRHAMRIGRAKGGALVARLDGTTFDEFTVWCGDGCKGIPLPWTFNTRSTWSRTTVWTDGAPRPTVVVGAKREAPEDSHERTRLQEERLRLEEQALENGLPLPGVAADARQRAEDAVRSVEGEHP